MEGRKSYASLFNNITLILTEMLPQENFKECLEFNKLNSKKRLFSYPNCLGKKSTEYEGPGLVNIWPLAKVVEFGTNEE